MVRSIDETRAGFARLMAAHQAEKGMNVAEVNPRGPQATRQTQHREPEDAQVGEVEDIRLFAGEEQKVEAEARFRGTGVAQNLNKYA